MTSPAIAVDAASATPPFEQVRAQLAQRIRAGAMAAGERLPTVRALAEDTGLAVNTVARAYRDLEAAGLVETRGRGGTVVSWSGEADERELQQAAAEFAGRVRRLGVPAETARALIDRALAAADAATGDR